VKRLHVHVAVHDLEQSIRFYSALFATQPAVKKDDYAKWMLDDPRVNFAISTRGKKAGLDHLGIQAESSAELEEIGSRLAQADVSLLPQKGAACCYAKSDKYWTLDPQGIAWESFHTLDTVPVYGTDVGTIAKVEKKSACCG
jgi:catechol 2,3-dioxygenase-like lactoylglutathione lyase family enzyme